LIAAAAIAADAYLTPLIVNRVTAATRAGISPCARAAAREIAAQPWAGREGGSASEADAWSRLAESLALGTDARVTIVRRDGEILGQSPSADPARDDGVALEPDIRDALRTGEGWTVTPSLTGGPRILDVAVAWEGSAGRSGAVRFAVPLTEATFARIELRRAIWCGAAIALLAALALSSVVASRVSGVASELTRAARRMSEGDLTVRTRLPGHDELAELGQALDRLAGGLATTLGELRAERDLQKRILEAMHEGVVVVDGDGRIALVNPAIRSMLLLGADAVGKLLIETMRHAQLHTMLERARAAPDDRLVEIELPGLKPRRMLVQVAPLAGAEGLLFVFVDVTELRRLESLRRDFVANASHELRTPIAAVRSARRLLAIGYRCRFEPHHLECVRIARERDFGTLKMIDAHFGFNIPAGVWRLNRALAGGGPLMDVGIYALQATRYLTGEEPAWLSATTTQGDPARFSEVEESIIWQAKFPGGAVSHCGSSYNASPIGYLRAIAERGWFALDPAFNYDGIHGMRSDGKAIDPQSTDQFAVEMDDFAQCILDQRATKVPGEEGLRDVRIMMALYESARSGRPIVVPSA